MDTKLTLCLDDRLIDRARRYSHRSGESVCSLSLTTSLCALVRRNLGYRWTPARHCGRSAEPERAISMRPLAVCAAVVVSFAFLFAAGCGGNAASDAQAAAEIRAELDGKRFVSEGEFPLGSVTTAVPGQIAHGHYKLWFRRDTVEWLKDDLCPTSPYEVDGAGNIESTDYFGNPVKGKYDRKSGRLQWDGAWYVPSP